MAFRGVEESEQPLKVVFGQERFSVWSAQKMHVLAGGLLGCVGLQFAQKRAGVGRVDDRQALEPLRLLVGQVPGHGATPVVRDQALHGPRGAHRRDQRDQVLHQVFGAVGLGGLGLAGFAKATQVGRHAVVATVFGAGKVQQQLIPDERAFREAVQKHQHRAAARATFAALQ